MITRETFKQLAVAIRNNGDISDQLIDGEPYRICQVSELSLILSRYKTGWLPEGITFELFGSEFFITPDGNVSLVEDSDKDNENIYTLSEKTILSAVSSFLKWRLTVLEKTKV